MWSLLVGCVAFCTCEKTWLLGVCCAWWLSTAEFKLCDLCWLDASHLHVLEDLTLRRVLCRRCCWQIGGDLCQGRWKTWIKVSTLWFHCMCLLRMFLDLLCVVSSDSCACVCMCMCVCIHFCLCIYGPIFAHHKHSAFVCQTIENSISGQRRPCNEPHAQCHAWHWATWCMAWSHMCMVLSQKRPCSEPHICMAWSHMMYGMEPQEALCSQVFDSWHYKNDGLYLLTSTKKISCRKNGWFDENCVHCKASDQEGCKGYYVPLKKNVSLACIFVYVWPLKKNVSLACIFVCVCMVWRELCALQSKWSRGEPRLLCATQEKCGLSVYIFVYAYIYICMYGLMRIVWTAKATLCQPRKSCT